MRKLSDDRLSPALLGFIREGIRFSFTNKGENGEEDVVLGSRLSFLTLLYKYTSWIKKNKAQIDMLRLDIDKNEKFLKDSEEFSDVHEDDLKALANFRIALGLPCSSILESNLLVTKVNKVNQITNRSKRSQMNSYDVIGLTKHQDTTQNLRVTSSNIKENSFTQGFGSSTPLLSSTSCTLPPLYEEDDYCHSQNTDRKYNQDEIGALHLSISSEASPQR